ncbi:MULTISPECIES: hypothetical protein [unclassified Chroococcidiopsis]|uniref:hypothetical protein n=1 Tax=unclassified Chroococcidiopsis TaxID=2646205 RepID=UPI0013049CBA|nr:MULTISPECIES: hypothetical protein [unclassified Chroococcidiopsis]MBE9015596.1 hypothetical protein [Chroococcidiopsidales cyanobacterium LEGE 13417]URD50891.1 hypothetical protein M5J74_02635 [Chroococcidiopsis sp. CCNUC1]
MRLYTSYASLQIARPYRYVLHPFPTDPHGRFLGTTRGLEGIVPLTAQNQH